MEARTLRVVILVATIGSLGANARTENFLVSAPTQQFAQEVAQEAEKLRRSLAVDWLGKELPQWSQPCPISVTVGPQLGAGGATSFSFHNGQVFGWKMNIQGSRERVLDSVLPHEITHTVFATYFRQPLPRWADEGACTTVEHVSERRKQQRMLIQFLRTRRGIAFDRMFAMKDYPKDVLPLYAQGYSTAKFLIGQKGKRHYVRFVGDGLSTRDWPGALKKHYGYRDLGHLQDRWLAWVKLGSPLSIPASVRPDTQVAAASSTKRDPGVTFRAQSADTPVGRPKRRSAPASNAKSPGPGAGNVAEWYRRGRGEGAKSNDEKPASTDGDQTKASAGADRSAEDALASNEQKEPADSNALVDANVGAASSDEPAKPEERLSAAPKIVIEWGRKSPPGDRRDPTRLSLRSTDGDRRLR